MSSGNNMEYGFLSPGCGLKVSKICLGTMTFGSLENAVYKLPGQLDEDGSHQILDRFVELGGNFIDTANVYSGGLSESILGSWVRKQTREDLVIATKCYEPTDRDRRTANSPKPNDTGVSRRNIIKSVEESLERLQTHYVDLYQVHKFDWGTPQRETLLTLNDLVRCGKVRYLGASNFNGWQLMEALNICQQMGLDKFLTLQNQYSMLCRDCELDVFWVCKQKGVGVIPWGPLKGGLLTDKCAKKSATLKETSRQNWASSFPDKTQKQRFKFTYDTVKDNQDFWTMMQEIKEIGQNHNHSVAQVSLKYLLQKQPVTSVIIGAKSIKQLEDNMAAGYKWHLSQEEMTRLDTASEFTLPTVYPFSLFSRQREERLNMK